MAKRLWITLLMVGMVAAFSACEIPFGDPAPLDTEIVEGVGTELVTEADLLLHIAKQTARDASIVLAGIMISGKDNVAVVICNDHDVPEKEWVSKRIISYQVGFGTEEGGHVSVCEGGPVGTVWFHWTFGKSVYVNGTVDITNCHKLPGGGTQTSGEYQDVTNNSSDPISQHLEHKVSETNSHETSLSETVDTTAGQSVEAGESFGGADVKATISFEEHFGLAKGSLDANETTTEQTVSLDVTIEPAQILGVTYTLDDTVTLCDSNINSQVDWSSLDAAVWRHNCGEACDSDGMKQLSAHNVYTGGSDRTIGFSFESIDDVVRLAAGTDPRCDGCRFTLRTAQYLGDEDTEQAYHRLTWPGHYRNVELKATRRTTTKDSASWRIDDITGLDHECVSEALGKEGNAVSGLDDKLAACHGS